MFTMALSAAEPVVFNARTAASGKWSDAKTWEDGRVPQAGDFVQVRAGHTVTYDVDSDAALRMMHVAGTLTFSREVHAAGRGPHQDRAGRDHDGRWLRLPRRRSRATRRRDHAGARNRHAGIAHPRGREGHHPLAAFQRDEPETLPAIIACGGRWDVHGAPMNRTWLKLAAPAKAGDMQRDTGATGDATGTSATASSSRRASRKGLESGRTFQKGQFARQKPVGTEERIDRRHRRRGAHAGSPAAARRIAARA